MELEITIKMRTDFINPTTHFLTQPALIFNINDSSGSCSTLL